MVVLDYLPIQKKYMGLSSIPPLDRGMGGGYKKIDPLKWPLFGYEPQTISTVPPDRSYLDRPFRGLIKPHTSITLGNLRLLLESPN